MGKKMSAVKASPYSIASNAHRSRVLYDKVWEKAARTPMFCRITRKSVGKGKFKDVYRTTRLVGSNAYKVAASGAALHAGRVLASECGRLRIPAYAESPMAPWMPTMKRGARMVLEQFLAALAQEAAHKAHVVCEGSGRKRLRPQDMAVGWDATYQTVFGAAAPLPRTVISMPVTMPASKVGVKRKQPQGEAKSASKEDDAEYEDDAEFDEE